MIGTCDILLPTGTCSCEIDTIVRVGVPCHGPVPVNLCWAHKDIADNLLSMLARWKVADDPVPVERKDLRKGQVLIHEKTNGLALVHFIGPETLMLQFPSGEVRGTTKEIVEAEYRISKI